MMESKRLIKKYQTCQPPAAKHLTPERDTAGSASESEGRCIAEHSGRDFPKPQTGMAPHVCRPKQTLFLCDDVPP